MAKWTIEQRAAIELRNANLLIAAAAGSGKTAVLVERITRLVLEKSTNIHEMLIVTFTNAAASEMRGRIETALSKAIEDHEADATYINSQIKLLSKANIKTFHAFCLDVIRSHFQKIDCDPGFKMLGEPERLILIKQAVEETVEQFYELNAFGFIDFVEAYSGNRNDEKLMELILQMHNFIQSQPHPERWMKEKSEVFANPDHPLKGMWWSLLKDGFVERLESANIAIANAIEICESSGGPEAYLPIMLSDQQKVLALIEASQNMTSFEKAVVSLEYDRMPTLKKDQKAAYDEELVAEVKDVIRKKRVKEPIEQIKAFFVYKSAQRFSEDIQRQSTAVETLVELTIAFSKRYQALKKQRNVMDFNDLEHYAIQILEDEDISKRYQEKFNFIFVDEYQDSSGIQEHIVNCIKRDNNVFMVGDVKQSIYKFRMADPDLFIEKYKTYDKLNAYMTIEEGTDAQLKEKFDDINHRLKLSGKCNCIRIDLKRNFRTRSEILDKVNAVFTGIMSERLGELTYDEDAMLYPGMAFETASELPVEVHILSKKAVTAMDDVEDDDAFSEAMMSEDYLEEKLRTEELEAIAIANAIKRKIGTPIYHPKEKVFKPCSYRDVVVLIRSSKSWTPTFEQIFSEEGIPLYADSNSGYFDTLEIKWLIALLKILVNPLQDLPLLVVLRSPLVGLTVDELVGIKQLSTEKTYFFLKCKKASESSANENPVLKQKLMRFFEIYENLFEAAAHMPLDAFIWKAMVDTAFFQYCSAMPGGVARQANLKLLVDRATMLKKSRVATLGYFIEFVEHMSTSNGDYGVAKVISEEDNVVRLMSIHKSKGLEFPVVIISGLGRKFNLMDTRGDLLLHKHLGIGLSMVDIENRVKSKTLPQFAIKEKIKRETLSEEMRVLYVALTRPVDQLLLFATVSDYEKKAEKWRRGVETLELSNASGFVDWLMPVFYNQTDLKVLVYDAEQITKELGIADEKQSREVSIWDHVAFDPKESIQNQTFSILDRLTFENPYKASAYRPLKTSVSEKKRSFEDEVPYKVPALNDAPMFMKSDVPLTAAEVGTAVHKVLEKIDLYTLFDAQDMIVYLDKLCDNRILTVQERQAIDVNKILAYLNSDLVKRMRNSHRIRRETPFVIKVEDQLVQGIIDLYFEEADGLVLVDYKTDRQMGTSPLAMAQKYATQLSIYENALVKLTRKVVKEKYIYFIDSNQMVQI